MGTPYHRISSSCSKEENVNLEVFSGDILCLYNVHTNYRPVSY